MASISCAIYTRVSTEEGLSQAFNSLEAQREAGEAYIVSQKEQGWVVLPERYDDGGFTGANMDRPALNRLLADIDRGRVHCVLVYKVDRMSRSLLDFARIKQAVSPRDEGLLAVLENPDGDTGYAVLLHLRFGERREGVELRVRLSENGDGQREKRGGGGGPVKTRAHRR